MGGWQGLDHLCKLNILSRLSSKELSVFASISREEREFVNDPLIWQKRLADEFGLSVKKAASQPAWAYKALYLGLAARKIGVTHQAGQPNTTYPVRFQALYTDGGVDEDLFKQYWADLALECNHWGAFCSKVSPNVNVLAVIQTPTEKEQASLHHRAFLADRCKFAAGRMLARVPLPPRDAPPTPRQQRYYAKAGAVLLRWSTPGLERLFCLLYASRKSGEPVGRSLDLGLNTAQGQGNPDAAEAVLRAKYTEILHSRLGQEAGDAMIQAESSPAQVLQALTASYQAAAAAAAAQNAELGSGGSGGGQTGGGVDPRDLAQDPSGLKLLHRKQAQKLTKPADLAPYTAVMDMIAVSRAGNNVFTCPVRTGAVLLGTVTGATPPCPKPGPSPDKYIPQSEMTARERAAAVDPRDAAAWDHVAGIVGQPSCAALDNVNSAEAVFAAVAQDSLPPVVQHMLLPHYEFIEFARPQRKSDSETTHPLHPVVWYRFFTNQEQAHLRAVDKERAAQLLSTQRERGSLRWTSLPRNAIAFFLTHLQRQQQQQQQQQSQQQSQQQEEAGGSSTKKGVTRGRSKAGASKGKDATAGSSSQAPALPPQQAERTRRGAKASGLAQQQQQRQQGAGASSRIVPAPLAMPQQLVVMSASGQLEVVSVEGLMAADVRVGLEQAAWGHSMMCAQDSLLAKERRQREQQSRQQQGQGGAEGGQQQQQGESMETEDESGDEGDVHTGSLMEEDLQNLQDQLDEESMLMGVEPPEDVGEMLTIMGYDNDGQGEEGGAEGMEQGEEGTSSGSSSSSGHEEEDTSDTEGHGGGHAPQDELGTSDEGDDDAPSDLLGMLDEGEIANRFADIMDTTPAPLSERLLLTQLAQHVGLHLLMNSHNELEREGQHIVEQELGMRAPIQNVDGRNMSTQPQQASEQPGSTGFKPSEVMRLLPGDETAADSTALHDGVSENEHTSHGGLLQCRLKQPRSGNMLCLKLISPENKMEEMQDMHDAPNVDLQFAAFRGVAMQLQRGMHLIS